MIAMFTVGPGVLERISKYMSCDIDRLINTGIKVDENNKAQSVKSTKEIIKTMDQLSRRQLSLLFIKLNQYC